MPVYKLRQLDSVSAGVTLPKDDLREIGVLDEEGQVDGEQHAVIEEKGPGEWNIRLVSEL